MEEYKVGDMVLLSTKELKWQMIGRKTDNLTERFVGPYRVKGIISSNAIDIMNRLDPIEELYDMYSEEEDTLRTVEIEDDGLDWVSDTEGPADPYMDL